LAKYYQKYLALRASLYLPLPVGRESNFSKAKKRIGTEFFPAEFFTDRVFPRQNFSSPHNNPNKFSGSLLKRDWNQKPIAPVAANGRPWLPMTSLYSLIFMHETKKEIDQKTLQLMAIYSCLWAQNQG
jgi:hypothetical protein